MVRKLLGVALFLQWAVVASLLSAFIMLELIPGIFDPLRADLSQTPPRRQLVETQAPNP
jgi:hypothetical protein